MIAPPMLPGVLRRCYSWCEERARMVSWLGRLLCVVGLHDLKVIEVSLTFGAGGQIEKLVCQRCGLTKTQRA